MLSLPGNLGLLAKLAARESGRFATQPIRLQETTEGYQVVATDGKRLAIVNGPGLLDDPVPALADIPDRGCEALVPATEWGRILKTCKRESAHAVIGGPGVVFAVGNAVEAVPVVDGRFPDVDHLLQQQCRSVIRVKFDARMVAELLAVAAAFADPQDGGNPVVLHFAGKDRPLLLTTRNLTGQQFLAAFMPLS